MEILETIEALRATHRQQRASLDAQTQQHNAQALCERVSALQEFQVSTHVASYIAIRGEIDTGPLMALGASEGKQLYLPVLREQSMHFAPWMPGEPLEKKGFGLLEPTVPESQWLDPDQLDLVLAPLLVFDRRCNRIGQGGGYYDRTFAFRADPDAVAIPLMLGVAHDSQCESKLQPESWDIPLDLIATNRELYRRV